MSSRASRCDEHLERDVLEAVRVNAQHVPDDETRDYDAILLDAVTVIDRLAPSPDPGAPVELKTCRRFVSDNGSRAGRRRGRWWISRPAHDKLLELDGAYLLAVLDEGDKLLADAIARSDVLDELLEGRWTTNGSGGGHVEESAQLPWPAVIGPEHLDGGGDG